MTGGDMLSPAVRERLEALEAAGCRDVAVARDGGGHACTLVLPDGREVRAEGAAADEAAERAAAEAELRLSEAV